MSASKPFTRIEFKDYCLRKLGAPLITINVAPEQIEDRVDEALTKFFERHMDAVETKYQVHFLSQQDLDRGYFIMSNNVQGVRRMFGNVTFGGTGVYAADYQIMLSDYLSHSGAYSVVGVQDWYITMRHLDLIEYLFNPDMRFNYNRLTGKLHFYGIRSDVGTPIILEIYERIVDSNGQDSYMWGDTWLGKYATALIKKQWGENLKKYEGVVLIGGTTLNGKTIFDEAEEKIKELEDELAASFEEPIDFFVG